MFDSPLPRHADLRKLVAQRGHLTGYVALSKLTRLADLLVASEGQARLLLVGDVGDDKRHVLNGEVRSTLALKCQRCLDPVSIDLEQSFALALIRGESEIQGLPRELDPLLVGSDPSDLWDLVSEELLLALPLVPMHQNEACAARPSDAVQADEQIRKNPFSALKVLKTHQ